MNASDLVGRVAARTGHGRREVRDVLDAAFEEIAAELVARQRVTLSGFGAFEVKRRAARLTRHPVSGDPVQIPDRDGITFRVAAGLIAAVRESTSGR